MNALNHEVLVTPDPGRLRHVRALGLVSILAPFFVFVAYAIVSYDQTFRAAEARAAHVSTVLQDHTQRVIETVQLALHNVGHLIEDADWNTIKTSRTLWDSIRKIQLSAPQIGSLFIIGPDGSDALTTRAFPPVNLDFSDRDYFVAQREADAGFFVGRSYMGKISTTPIFNFSIRKPGRDGGFDGVIGSSAYVKYFQDFYATVGDPDDRYSVLLIRADGALLARYPTYTVGYSFTPEQFRVGNEQRQITYGVSPVDGKERLFSSAKIANYPVYVAYAIERAAVVERWRKGLAVPGAVALSLTLLIWLLTSYAVRRARKEGVAVALLKDTATSLQSEIERRQRAEATLLQTQKLDAVGRLAGGIAHDFNNLLTIILGNLSLAERRNDFLTIRRLLGAAKQAAERGADLTRQLLAFSRGQPLRPRVIDLAELLGEARSWMNRAVTEAITLEFDCQPGLWPVHVDTGQLEAALLNLVVNARDAMTGRGRLVVSARNVSMTGSATGTHSLRPGDYVRISVTDTGTGMPPEVVAQVYEPFFTTKDIGKGSGLGLSQVHGFIRQSNGEILIDSKVGKGTTVSLYLPRSTAAPEPSQTATDGPAADTSPRDKVVLVIEDEKEVAKLFVTFLYELGFDPIAARSPREALAIVTAGEPIDILITDLVMPGMDGIEIAKRIAELRPGIDIVLATASLDVSAPYRVLAKPFTREQLAAALGLAKALPQ